MWHSSPIFKVSLEPFLENNSFLHIAHLFPDLAQRFFLVLLVIPIIVNSQ